MTELAAMARRIRCDVVRTVHEAGSGHPGAALSAVDIVATLYFRAMHLDPRNPHWRERDRFILSKGHAYPALYAALARTGFSPVAELGTLWRINSRLRGHPDMRKTSGVDMTSGSLGDGLGCAVGMALAARTDGLPSRIYVLLGDGKAQAGPAWEAAMAAAHCRHDSQAAGADRRPLGAGLLPAGAQPDSHHLWAGAGDRAWLGGRAGRGRRCGQPCLRHHGLRGAQDGAGPERRQRTRLPRGRAHCETPGPRHHDRERQADGRRGHRGRQ